MAKKYGSEEERKAAYNKRLAERRAAKRKAKPDPTLARASASSNPVRVDYQVPKGEGRTQVGAKGNTSRFLHPSDAAGFLAPEPGQPMGQVAEVHTKEDDTVTSSRMVRRAGSGTSKGKMSPFTTTGAPTEQPSRGPNYLPPAAVQERDTQKATVASSRTRDAATALKNVEAAEPSQQEVHKAVPVAQFLDPHAVKSDPEARSLAKSMLHETLNNPRVPGYESANAMSAKLASSDLDKQSARAVLSQAKAVEADAKTAGSRTSWSPSAGIPPSTEVSVSGPTMSRWLGDTANAGGGSRLEKMRAPLDNDEGRPATKSGYVVARSRTPEEKSLHALSSLAMAVHTGDYDTHLANAPHSDLSTPALPEMVGLPSVRKKGTTSQIQHAYSNASIRRERRVARNARDEVHANPMWQHMHRVAGGGEGGDLVKSLASTMGVEGKDHWEIGLNAGARAQETARQIHHSLQPGVEGIPQPEWSARAKSGSLPPVGEDLGGRSRLHTDVKAHRIAADAAKRDIFTGYVGRMRESVNVNTAKDTAEGALSSAVDATQKRSTRR